ncbi:MAG: spore cortex biosynthesis protein YabQ [Clostridia bacterium]|nr:spore cortex biosynthesis protein YabQ [Clostridia bacterium]
MEISQYALLLLYVYAGILGICLGFFYDGIRITRIFLGAHYSRRVAKRLQGLRLPFLKKKPARAESRFLGLAIFLEDLFFCVFAGVSFILLLYAQNNGRFRFLALICTCLGFLLYRLTLSRPVMYASEWVSFGIGTAIRYLAFFLLYPVRVLRNLLFRLAGSLVQKGRARISLLQRRRYTALRQKRLTRDACGMLPEEIPRPRKGKKGNRYDKGKQKTVQPQSAGAHSSGRDGGNIHRHFCQ